MSWNSANYLSACLHSIAETVRTSHEVIVADNGSSDGVQEMLGTQFPSVQAFDTGGNRGFAWANNLAIRRARGRFLILLNPDTVVLPGALDGLVDHLRQHPEAGVVAPRLLNTDLSDQGTARAFPTPTAAIFGRRSLLTRAFPRNRWSRRYLIGTHRSGADPFTVEWVSGACLMTRREAVERAGLLDEGFFMHFEDADWCYRIRSQGYEVHCAPGLRVVHHQGGSRRGWPPSQVLAFHHGAYRFYSKHMAPQTFHPMRLAAALGLATRATLLIAGNQLKTLVIARRPPIQIAADQMTKG